MKKANIILIVSAVLLLASCGAKKTWYTNFDEAKKQAQKEKKDIYLLFSGDDWTDNSVPFKQNVVNDEFINLTKDKYIFVNVDFSDAEFAKTELPENATDAQKKEADKIQQEYKVKYSLSRLYDVREWPCAYILSQEGYILAELEYDHEIGTTQAYVDSIADFDEEIASMKELIAKVKSATGKEKVLAIEDMINEADANSRMFRDLVKEVIVLDKDDETGLLGKYELTEAYFEVYDMIMDKKDVTPEPFLSVIEKGHLNDSQTQEAYYEAASLLASTGSTDYEKMAELLENAYKADFESEAANEILASLEHLRTYIRGVNAGVAPENTEVQE